LTPYSLEKSAWVAWQFDDPEQGGGMVQAFRRADCAADSLKLTLRGLDPTAAYVIENLDSDKAQTHSGRELIEQGLHVNIPERPGSALLVYRMIRD
jgi:alpha-galactosidase